MTNANDQADNQERLKRALLALQKMQTRLDMAENKHRQALAIVGMGCRYPGGANTPEQLWRLLVGQVDAISEVPEERWSIADYYDADPATPGKIYTRYGGFIDHAYDFDAGFFSIAPREALDLDPQQRLLLEVTWEALENAAIAPVTLKGSQTGVFIGISSTEYGQLLMNRPPEAIDSYVGSGNAHSVAAGRLSYFLDLQGPSIAIDTACSSSLVALHLACQSLRSGESNLAISGGVNVLLTPSVSLNHSRARMLAPDGRCKAFDAAADGFIRADGCGIVLLKRLADAEAAGDHILAVIRGSAVNQDGHTSGLTVPNGPSQQAVITKALGNAGLRPEQISYLEAHGTGTALGDPIEIGALTAVFGQRPNESAALRIGSIKTNIGHAEAAAGAAGVIKTVLALQHQEIPAHLHYQTPNPLIDWRGFPGEIPTEAKAWPAAETPRYAGISSFGFGGTNGHIVLSDYNAGAVPASITQTAHILALSAKSETALQVLRQRYRDYLSEHPKIALADVCYSAATGRNHFDYRQAWVVESITDLATQLDAADNAETVEPKSIEPRIVFLFTGQGSQYPDMGRELYDTEPVFQRALQRCQTLLQAEFDMDLLAMLYPESESESEAIHQTAYAQPAIFALEYALAELWRNWGIEPDAVIGHSVGEYAAAVVAGIFNLEDGLRLIAERGRLMQALPATGGMLAVAAKASHLDGILESYRQDVAIAAINSADKLVLSGASEALAAIEARLVQEGINSTRLTVSHAFHSPLMEPMLAAFERYAANISFSSPALPFMSNVTGNWADSEVRNAGYWTRHIRQPVRFADGMAALSQRRFDAFIEIGAKPVLLGMTELSDQALALPSLRPGQSDSVQMRRSLAALYQAGCKVTWSALYPIAGHRKVVLPNYPFQRQEYRIKTAIPATFEPETVAQEYESVWQQQTLPSPESRSPRHWLIFADHQGFTESLTAHLSAQGDSWHCVYAESGYRVIDAQASALNPTSASDYRRLLAAIAPPDCVLHAWSLDVAQSVDATLSDLQSATAQGTLSTLYLTQALAAANKAAQLWLLTCNSQAVAANDSVAGLLQAPLWGLGKTLALEYPELWGGMIDLGAANAQAAKQLAQVIGATSNEDAWALRDGYCFVERLQKRMTPSTELTLKHDASYLITGGLGGLGLVLADWLVRKGAKQLILAGRRGLTNEVTARTVRKLEQAGAEIRVLTADVSDETAVQQVFQTIAEHCLPLAGIVHAAGLPGFCPADALTAQHFDDLFAAKVYGTWLLERYSEATALDFFVCCSSMVSVWGAKGQGHYVAANQFLDSVVQQRRQRGLTGLSINWGPMTGGGMLPTENIDELAKIGVSTIPLTQAGTIVERLLAAHATQVTVAAIDWVRYKTIYEIHKPKPLFEKLAATGDIKPSAQEKPAGLLPVLQQAPVSERPSLLSAHVSQALARILGVTGDIAPKQGFFDLGIDSLTAMELKNRLQADLALSLPASLAFDYATVETLTAYLLKRLNETHEPAPAFDDPVELPEARTAVADLEAMTEQDAEALLLSKLQALDDDED